MEIEKPPAPGHVSLTVRKVLQSRNHTGRAESIRNLPSRDERQSSSGSRKTLAHVCCVHFFVCRPVFTLRHGDIQPLVACDTGGAVVHSELADF